MSTQALTVSVPHRLAPEEARRRLEKGIADLRSRAGGMVTNISERWTNNRLDFGFTAMGQSVTGSVDVQPSVAIVSVHLPWILAALAERIRPQIQQEATKLLEGK